MGEIQDPTGGPGGEGRRKRPNRNGDGGNAPGHAEDHRLRELLEALQAAGQGDFAVRLPFTRGSGLMPEIARAFNAVVSRNEALTGARSSGRILRHDRRDTAPFARCGALTDAGLEVRKNAQYFRPWHEAAHRGAPSG